MRFRHSAPIDWPEQGRWDALVDPAEDLPPLDASGRVVFDDADDLPPDLWVGLVGGVHGQPGARYEVREPTLTRGRVTARIDGSPLDRTVAIDYREPHGAGASVVIDGVDRVRSLRATSDLPHLGLDIRATTSPPAVLQASLRLDWLRADLAVQVRGQRARVRGTIRGVGRWRLLLAPVWWVLRMRTDVGKAVHDQVVEIAAGGDGWPAVPTGQRQARRRDRQVQVTEARIRRWQRLGGLLDEAIAAVEAKPRFRRANAVWIEATSSIPTDILLWRDPKTPAEIPVLIDGKAIAAIIDSVGAAPHIERSSRAHTLIAAQIDEERRAPRPAVDGVGEPVPVDADAWADLRWLRNPVTMLRHVLTQMRGPDARPVSLWRPWTWTP